MYRVGDLIIYGNYGVCRVEMITTLDILGVDKSKLYYTIRPLYHNEKIYAPTDTNVFIRPIITKTEAQKLISHIPSINEGVCKDSSQRAVKDYYKELLQTHDCSDLLKLIKTVNTKNKAAMEQGKKPGQINERYIRIAVDLLDGELAVALGIPKESVKSYVEERTGELEN
ncbi:MAG: CarD family transcriptional regulator [Clostridiaceae bacterium]|nr:CarD family transcriptional regulator [Clostridiaceae bacterium]